MTFLDSMQKRYTTKLYNADKKLDPSQLEQLKEILRLAPSSINSQPWKFLFINNMEVLAKLAKASRMNDQKVMDCDTLIVLCGVDDTDMLEADMQQRLPEGSFGYYQDLIKPLGQDHVREWSARQTYLALGILLGACAEMGIDSTPIEGLEPEKYDDILQVQGYKVLVAVAVGVRDQADENQPHITPKSRKDFSAVVKEI